MINQRKHICVCICTYKRPKLLNKLLLELEKQQTEKYFDFSILVVDNDKAESAKNTVEDFANRSHIVVKYYVEPEQSIALVRNKAIKMAKGDFVALIDDDEYPESSWLLNLYKAINNYKSDGILGPVLPYFEEKPPNWILKGKFFERPTHVSGHVLNWQNTRTGNALIRMTVFKSEGKWFDPKFGSGGEDRDFFRRMIDKNKVFIWCNKAIVYELVTTERCKRTVMLRRALLRGQKPGFTSIDYIKSVLAVLVYTSALPFLFIFGHHLFMKYLISECDHIGRLISLFGIKLIKEKYIIG